MASLHALPLTHNLVVTRQDDSHVGYIEKYDTHSGQLLATSNETFSFSWPLVEMTWDANTGNVYTVTYPSDADGPVLYLMDSNLDLIYEWLYTPFSFFDLQYSPVQDAVYGILVTTTYGRALSNFTLDQQADTIIPHQLYTLPYMWYVNASSFDAVNCRFFGLINNFPGFDNSTLDQQLVVANLSVDSSVQAPHVDLLPVSSQDMFVRFVTYAQSISTLFCAGITRTKAEVAVFDERTGTVGTRIFERSAIAVGPLMYVPNGDVESDQLIVYVQTDDQPVPVWEMWSINVYIPSFTNNTRSVAEAKLVSTYWGLSFEEFAAATTTTK